jgi:hypothetical protein
LLALRLPIERLYRESLLSTRAPLATHLAGGVFLSMDIELFLATFFSTSDESCITIPLLAKAFEARWHV